MKWSIRARLSAVYSAIVVVVVVASAVVVAVVQERMSLRRLDEEIARQMLTLQAVMHTEFGKGLNLEVSAEEASGEVVAPGRVLALLKVDGTLLAMWGPAIDGAWRPPVDTDVRFHTIAIGSERGRLLSERVEHDGFRYVAAVVAPLADFERDMGQLRRSLHAGDRLGPRVGRHRGSGRGPARPSPARRDGRAGAHDHRGQSGRAPARAQSPRRARDVRVVVQRSPRSAGVGPSGPASVHGRRVARAADAGVDRALGGAGDAGSPAAFGRRVPGVVDDRGRTSRAPHAPGRCDVPALARRSPTGCRSCAKPCTSTIS